MKRSIYFIYGVSGYLVFLLLYAYMAGFVGNFLVPKSIDSSPAECVLCALSIDLLLIVMFGLQHSIMARPGFKEKWTKLVPQVIERSTYVWLSCVVLAILMWQWQAVDMIIWHAEQPILRGLLWGLFAFGWFLVPLVSMMIDHFDLFGTRQVWLHLLGHEYMSHPFATPMLYKYVRHPLYIGWAIAFWATPTMTLGHLLFAVGMTVYMLVAVVFEERDLIRFFGSQYEQYRRQVPKFLPGLGAAKRGNAKSEELVH